MICVEGGTFTMGSSVKDEFPAHEVVLETFFISETEVTQKLWISLMGNNPSEFVGLNRPVEQVSWHECQKFVEQLKQETNKPYRLPTEAEWEYAARGGNRSHHYKFSGNNNLDIVGWYSHNSNKCTHEVKSKEQNELGIYDMNGNVWEWCQDWYGLYSGGKQYSPQGPVAGEHKIIRGGGWNNVSEFFRTSYRGRNTPTRRGNNIGFRIVCNGPDNQDEGAKLR